MKIFIKEIAKYLYKNFSEVIYFKQIRRSNKKEDERFI